MAVKPILFVLLLLGIIVQFSQAEENAEDEESNEGGESQEENSKCLFFLCSIPPAATYGNIRRYFLFILLGYKKFCLVCIFRPTEIS